MAHNPPTCPVVTLGNSCVPTPALLLLASKVKHFAGGEGEFLVHLSLQGEAERKEEEANGSGRVKREGSV